MDFKILLCMVFLGGSIFATEGNVCPTDNSSWVKISKENCQKSGGSFSKEGACQAKWKEAVEICKKSGATLPSVEELYAIINDCGGKEGDYKNAYNKSYTSQYRKKGFNGENNYWSATSYHGIKQFAWVVYFYNGTKSYYSKNRNYTVSCVH